MAAVDSEANLDDIVHSRIGDQQRCGRPAIEHRAFQTGFTPEHLQGGVLCVLDGFLLTQQANEMHLKPFISGIKFGNEMRHPFRSCPRQYALSGTKMIGSAPLRST
jgi:hypothetical protein